MSDIEKPHSVPTGTTIPDLLLHVVRSPFLVVPLLFLIAAVIVCVAMGFIDISWGDGGSGIKVTQGHHSSSGTEINVAGDWDGNGKDLSDSEKKIAARYAYKMKFKFTQDGDQVKMTGSYYILDHPEAPGRLFTGQGVMHGDYLSILYDIQAGTPVVARTHGTMLFQIQPSANSATGYYVTRSMMNDGFVFGTIILSR